MPNAINSVTFGTLSNATNAQYAFPHYVFYNNLSTANFTKGETYNLSVSFEVNGGCGYGIWIDYNQDNQFDPSEKVSGTDITNSMDISANTVITETITIPESAMTGETRMRIRIVEDDDYTFGPNGYSIQPCNASTSAMDIMDWGETEDYTINIKSSSVGVNDITISNNFSIAPNPVKSTLNVVRNTSTPTAYKIINIMGRAVLSGTINNMEQQINVSKLTGGIYFIQLIGDKQITQERFIKTSGN